MHFSPNTLTCSNLTQDIIAFLVELTTRTMKDRERERDQDLFGGRSLYEMVFFPFIRSFDRKKHVAKVASPVYSVVVIPNHITSLRIKIALRSIAKNFLGNITEYCKFSNNYIERYQNPNWYNIFRSP